MGLLALISVFVVGAGTATFFLIRAHDLKRVSHLERVIRCQDNRECREFIERAIRDTLKNKGVKVDRKHGISLRIEEAGGMPQGTIAIGPDSEPSPGPTPSGSLGPSKGLGGSGGTQTPKKPPAPVTEPPASPEETSPPRPEAPSAPPGGRQILPPVAPICVSVGEVVETCRGGT